MLVKKLDRTGERFITKEGYEIEIIKYINATDLWVRFNDEFKATVHSNYKACRKGSVKNPYHPNRYGGYFGQGKYGYGQYPIKYYETWINMLTRAYDKKYKEVKPTYEEVTVNPCFLNFQVFAEWCDNNYYEIVGETMCLDKDIMCKGNREYSPSNCIFVPNRINMLFVKRHGKRDGMPIGVIYDSKSNKYLAQCSILNDDGKHENIYLGRYNTKEQAFQVYKEFKEQYIQQVADEYKGKIPKELYNAMYNYIIEEDD